MKRFIKVIAIFVVCIALIACGKNADDDAIGDVPPDGEIPTSSPGDGSAGESSSATDAPPAEMNLSSFNPLTGLNDMKDYIAGQRPVAVCVNNYRYSREQTGLSKADIIVEAVSEQGHTQIVCLFTDVSGLGKIGPIDCIYNTFVKALGGLDPIFVHYGQPVDYPNTLVDTRAIPTLDGEKNEAVIYVDEDRHEDYLIEYSRFTDGARINAAIQGAFAESLKEGGAAFNFVPPGTPKTVPSTGEADSVSAAFSGIYDVDMRYDAETDKYLQFQFLYEHTDKANKKQLEFENVFILFARFDSLTDLHGTKNRLVEADFSPGGKGYYFSGGRYERISWKMGEEFFEFFTGGGDPLSVNVGKSYIAIIDEQNEYAMKIEG